MTLYELDVNTCIVFIVFVLVYNGDTPMCMDSPSEKITGNTAWGVVSPVHYKHVIIQSPHVHWVMSTLENISSLSANVRTLN
jgi:hypothetical protein